MIHEGARVRLNRNYCSDTRGWHDEQCQGSEGTVVSPQAIINDFYTMTASTRNEQYISVRWDNRHKNAYKLGSLIPTEDYNVITHYNCMVRLSRGGK